MNLASTLKKFNVPQYIAQHPVRPLLAKAPTAPGHP